MADYDVIVVGAGPSGSVCAARCAEAGLRTLLLERTIFPREKVCGDCLNPLCWPVLDRLGLSERLLALPHSRFRELEFAGINGASIRFELPVSARSELAVKRSLFDHLLLARAGELGAEIRQGTPVKSISQGWRVQAGAEEFTSNILVAADGRNSPVARLLGVLPSPGRERVALQAHIPTPAAYGEKLSLRFLKWGYCGMANIGGGEVNICLVGAPEAIPQLKKWGERNAGVPPDYPWRTITPLSRAPIAPAIGRVIFVGDAARVVEPFTGEGIAYGLASGELAAAHIIHAIKSGYNHGFANYCREHRDLYKGRLWINQLSRQAVLNPRLGNVALGFLRRFPGALRFLTGRVIGPIEVRNKI